MTTNHLILSDESKIFAIIMTEKKINSNYEVNFPDTVSMIFEMQTFKYVLNQVSNFFSDMQVCRNARLNKS